MTSIKFFDKHFGKASLTAKLSLVINISLAYVISGMKNREDGYVRQLLECHQSKYKDLTDIILMTEDIKRKSTNPETKEDLGKLVEEVKSKAP